MTMEHPTGIQPWGNYYMRGGGPNIRDSGLGDLSVLSDALVLELFSCGVLRAVDVGRLALASKAFYCFANLEDIWKGMVIEELGGNFSWCGTWQRTYLASTGLVHGEARGDEDGGGSRGSLSDDDQQWSDIEEEEEQEEEEEDEGEESGSEKADSESSSETSSGCSGDGHLREEGKGAEVEMADGLQRDGERDGSPASLAEAASGCTAAASVGCDKKAAALAVGACVVVEANECAIHSCKRRKVDGVAGSAGLDHPGASGIERRGLEDSADVSIAGGLAVNVNAGANADVGAALPGASGAEVPHGSLPRCNGGRRLLRRVRGCGPQRYLCVHGFYSDLLYQPWFCATLKLPHDWLAVDNIDRRSGLTAEQFRREYEIPNRPVILTDVMSSWPAMAKWSRGYFAEVFGSREVIVGNMPMPFTTYLSYCSSNRDEMPLYLFDKHFVAVAPSLESDYVVPPQFGEDLFGLLEEEGRPDYRWLILGPSRSGSSFHVDPNATSAWNALLWGAKKWVMYPPGSVPPGVHPSPDGADVATPLSLTEWFVNFYAATREGKTRPIEFVARPGDLLFVPRGWWHCALNLEESCALTQNFVSEVGLPATLAFLKSRRPELVSGCAHENRGNLYDRFVAVLRKKRPQVLAAVEARQQEARARAQEANRLAALFRSADRPHCNGNNNRNGSVCNNGNSNGNGVYRAVSDGLMGPDAAGKDAGAGTGGPDAGGSGGFSFGFSFGNGGGPSGGVSGGKGGDSGGGFKFGFGLSY